MTGREMLSMGRKAESIYTAMEKNRMESKRKKTVFGSRNNVSAFEEHMKRNAASRACYVYINGISMPVLSA